MYDTPATWPLAARSRCGSAAERLYDRLRMRRVLLLFEPPDGGVPAHVLALARGLPAHGWLPVVAGPAQAAAYGEFERAGVAVLRLPMGRSMGPRRSATTLRAVRRLIREQEIDLVHAHSSKAGVVGRIAARLARTPSVYTPHCFAFIREGSPATRRGIVFAERTLARITGAVVCVAEFERSAALRSRVASRDRLHVVHNGSDGCAADAEPDAELRAFAGDGALVACMSVLRPQKSVETFIAAAPELLAAAPEARLAVIGEGELRDQLERQAAALGLDGRLRFFDFHPPVWRQLRQLDLLVLPSAWEAFPIALLEAMACGVPQVASDVGGVGEAVGDSETGLLVPPRDPLALAHATVELLRDPERRARMAEAGRRRHAELFTVGRMVDRTARVYEQALDGGRAG
jgi:glycosyltransferase involved in cell wall biosynthesis